MWLPPDTPKTNGSRFKGSSGSAYRAAGSDASVEAERVHCLEIEREIVTDDQLVRIHLIMAQMTLVDQPRAMEVWIPFCRKTYPSSAP